MCMTTSTTDTVTISLHHSDAVRYVRSARRPAVPEVRDLIKEVVDQDPFAARHDIVIPVATARTFVKKSTRPLRLWTGQTMKSLLQYALEEYDEQHSTVTPEPVEPDGTMTADASGFMSESEEGAVPAAVEASEGGLPAEVTPDEDAEAAADLLLRDDQMSPYPSFDTPTESAPEVHSDEPDQEPSPVAEESSDEDPTDPGFPTTTHDEQDDQGESGDDFPDSSQLPRS
jgi:hypothetical protein